MPFEREIRDAEMIERWGIVRMHLRGTMGAHSHRVAIYADQMATILKYDGDRAALLRHGLWHDMPEVFTGDLPGPFKRRVVDGHQLHDYETLGMEKRFPQREWSVTDDGQRIRAIVKTADLLDEVLSCVIERRMGNGTMSEIENNSILRLDDSINVLHGRFDRSLVELLYVAVHCAIELHGVVDSVITIDK